MKDSYGRIIDYMRISITDRCNLRCKYCMPSGVDFVPMSEILTFEEIIKVVESASQLGIRHIKLTGGEPLVRLGCCYLLRQIKKIPGIEKVTITTNGILLEQYLEMLIDAGIDAINISLDTRDREMFAYITGSDSLPQVMKVIEKVEKIPIPIKINAVSLDLGRKNWEDMVELAKEYPVDVRFIEMMPIGCGKKFPVISHEKLLNDIKEQYPEMDNDYRIHGFGPAVYYRIPGFKGSIGFISAIHNKFCNQCNRVRLTSQGYLKTCLCYEDGYDLRGILRSGDTDSEIKSKLKKAISEAIFRKSEAHCFESPALITEQHMMASIGG